MPVCAPYVTIINYKYKSKLVPGTLKKGKAVKTVMSVFLSQKELSEVEKKLMRTMGETELVNVMIGNVKIGAAGKKYVEIWLFNKCRVIKGEGEREEGKGSKEERDEKSGEKEVILKEEEFVSKELNLNLMIVCIICVVYKFLEKNSISNSSKNKKIIHFKISKVWFHWSKGVIILVFPFYYET